MTLCVWLNSKWPEEFLWNESEKFSFNHLKVTLCVWLNSKWPEEFRWNESEKFRLEFRCRGCIPIPQVAPQSLAQFILWHDFPSFSLFFIFGHNQKSYHYQWYQLHLIRTSSQGITFAKLGYLGTRLVPESYPSNATFWL